MAKHTGEKTGKDKTKSPLKADKETLSKTDPQENMEGPLSSILQNIKDKAEEDDDESKEAADKKKDKNM